MTVYTKPHLSFADQVGLLKSRGLIIDDEAEAERLLSVIGYYRLSGYWYSYRRPLDGVLRHDNFLEGTTFRQVVRLYDADRRLKLQLLDALERIEIALRVMIGFILGRRGAYAHLADQLAPSHLRSIPDLRHLTDRQVSHFRIYSTLCVVGFLLSRLGHDSHWTQRIRDLLSEEVPACGRDLRELGFPAGWAAERPWIG